MKVKISWWQVPKIGYSTQLSHCKRNLEFSLHFGTPYRVPAFEVGGEVCPGWVELAQLVRKKDVWLAACKENFACKEKNCLAGKFFLGGNLHVLKVLELSQEGEHTCRSI